MPPIVKQFRLTPFPGQEFIHVDFELTDGTVVKLRLESGLAEFLANQLPERLSQYTVEYDAETDQGRVGLRMWQLTEEEKMDHRFSFSAIPDHYNASLGRLISAWSRYELQVTEVLTALVAANESDPRISNEFKRKSDRLRAEMKKQFSTYPTITAELSAILNAAADLNWRRNVIIHGELSVAMTINKELHEPPTAQVFMEATGKHNGNPVTLRLSKQDLDDFYWKMGNLTARLYRLLFDGKGALALPAEERAGLNCFVKAWRLNPADWDGAMVSTLTPASQHFESTVAHATLSQGPSIGQRKAGITSLSEPAFTLEGIIKGRFR